MAYDATNFDHGIPLGTCLICRHGLYLQYGRVVDDNWDEERCYPHDDPDKRHITKAMLIDAAARAGAPRPSSVARAYIMLLNFYYFAPISKDPASMMQAVSYTMRRDRFQEDLLKGPLNA